MLEMRRASTLDYMVPVPDITTTWRTSSMRSAARLREMADSEIVDRSLARGCNPPSVAVNVVASTSTIGQCSATVVTVPSSGCASVYAGQRRRHPVTVVRLPSAGVQTQPAGSVSRLAQTQSAVTIGLPSQSNTAVRQVNFTVKVI